MAIVTFGNDTLVVSATLADQRKRVLEDMLKLRKLGARLGIAEEPVYLGDLRSLGCCYMRLAQRVGHGRARRLMDHLQMFAEKHLDYFSAMSKMPSERSVFMAETARLFPNMKASAAMGGAAPLMLLGLLGATIAVIMAVTSKKAHAAEAPFAPKKDEVTVTEPEALPVSPEEPDDEIPSVEAVKPRPSVKPPVKPPVRPRPEAPAPEPPSLAEPEAEEIAEAELPPAPLLPPAPSVPMDVQPPPKEIVSVTPLPSMVTPGVPIQMPKEVKSTMTKNDVNRLQLALNRLARATGDFGMAPAGIRVFVTPTLNEPTVAATNRAFVRHFKKGTKVPSQLRTGRLNADQIAANFTTIVKALITEAERLERLERRGVKPATQIVSTPVLPSAVKPGVPVVAPKPVASRMSKTDANRLQLALNRLAKATGDIQMPPAGIRVFVAPSLNDQTIQAVNRALTRHFGAGTRSVAALRTGKLGAPQIEANLKTIINAFLAEAVRREKLPKAQQPKIPKTVPLAPVLAQYIKQPGFAPVAVKSTPPKKMSTAQLKVALGKELQLALNRLSVATKDKAIKVAVDGKPGKATLAAVNRSFTKHIGSGQAPAALRTGKLTLPQVLAQLKSVITIMLKEVERRTKKTVPAAEWSRIYGLIDAYQGTSAPAPVATVRPTAAPAAKPVVKAAAPKLGAAQLKTALGKELQLTLNRLSAATKDKALKVAVDGKPGRATLAAVNRAMTKHIGKGQASAALRTGRLTLPLVLANLKTIITIMLKEVERRTKKTVPAAEWARIYALVSAYQATGAQMAGAAQTAMMEIAGAGEMTVEDAVVELLGEARLPMLVFPQIEDNVTGCAGDDVGYWIDFPA